jgi:hypothetical protein
MATPRTLLASLAGKSAYVPAVTLQTLVNTGTCAWEDTASNVAAVTAPNLAAVRHALERLVEGMVLVAFMSVLVCWLLQA